MKKPIKHVAFDNKVIIPRNQNKPHIVKIDGYWRVSPKPRRFWGCSGGFRWDRAGSFVNKLNAELMLHNSKVDLPES